MAQKKLATVDSLRVPTGRAPVGCYAPLLQPGLVQLPLTADFTRFGKFVAPADMTAKSIRFALAVAAGSNDNCGAAIWAADGVTRLNSTGSIAAKLNAAAGPQTLTLPDTPLVANTVYYAAFWSGTIGTTAAEILAAGTSLGNGAINLAGIAVPLLDYGRLAGAAIPTSLAGFTPWGSAPLLYIGE